MSTKRKSKKTTQALRAKTLVQAWLEVELDKNKQTLTKTLEKMNKKLGSAHTHSRVREWEENRNGRGNRLPREVRMFMAKIVCKDILSDVGLNTKDLTSSQINKIVRQFC